MSDIASYEQRQIDSFLELQDPRERGEYLARMSEEGRKGFYMALAQYDDLNLEDVIGLPAPWRHEANFHLIGNDHDEMKIRPCNRSFVIGPVEDDKPVKVENGTDRGERLWLTIDKPAMLNTRQALNCLMQYGQHAEHEHQRGKLRQMSQEELARWYSAQAETKTKAKSKK